MTPRMISFIVIGKSVARTIEACLRSVMAACEAWETKDFEVLYIDSQSDDNTLNIVTNLPWVKSYKILGHYNAAIARNIGAKEASGDIFFFLDGDMTLEHGFLNKVLNNDNTLTYPFVSGDILNVNYDSNGKLLGESDYFNTRIESDRYEVTTGGVFVIDAALWKRNAGMNTKLKRGEDIDLGLRLSRSGIRLLRKKDRIVKHHTVSYFDRRRSVTMLLNGDFCYVGVTARLNILNPHSFRFLLRNNYSSVLLFGCVALSWFTNGIPLLLYIALTTARTLMQIKKNHFSLIRYFLIYTFIDIQVLAGFFAVYPSKKSLHYEQLPSVNHADQQ